MAAAAELRVPETSFGIHYGAVRTPLGLDKDLERARESWSLGLEGPPRALETKKRSRTELLEALLGTLSCRQVLREAPDRVCCAAVLFVKARVSEEHGAQRGEASGAAQVATGPATDGVAAAHLALDSTTGLGRLVEELFHRAVEVQTSAGHV